MTEPEVVIYERLYTVSQDYGGHESHDCVTAQEAGAQAAEMLARGIYSVKIYRVDRERKGDG